MLHDGLLLVHAVGAEGVVELTPQPLMVLVVSADQAEVVIREVETTLLGPLSLSGPVLEDLGPADGSVDREVVWRDAHDGAILFMQLSALPYKGSCDVAAPCEGKVCCCIELGSRIFGQGVERQAVDDDGKAPEDKKLELSMVVSYNIMMPREYLIVSCVWLTAPAPATSAAML